MEPLRLPLTLCANPTAYDYVHAMHLNSNNGIEFVAGDGQKMWLEAKGSFELVQHQNLVQLRVYNLTWFDPDDHNSAETCPDFECHGVLEPGEFILQDGIPTLQPSNRARGIAFNRRIVFENDPILLAGRSDGSSIPVCHDESERIYYPMNEGRHGLITELNQPRLIL